MKTSLRLLILVLGVAFLASCLDDGVDEPSRTEADELAEISIYLDTLENRGLDVDTTELGVYYVIDSLADGPFPQSGDTCIVKYNLFTMSGYLIDSSLGNSNNPEGTFQFTLDVTNMVEGWNDGIKHINEGSKAYLIVPSSYGYGANQYYSIGPYQTLIFSIEMVEIKQAY